MTTRLFAAVLAAAVAVTVAGCGSTSRHATAQAPLTPISAGPHPTAIPPYPVAKLVHPASGKYVGVFPDSPPGSLTAVRRFAASIGAKPNIIGTFVAWNTPFNAQAVANAWSYGALYYMAWEPFGTTVQAIAEGKSDAYVTQFATAVRTLNLPIAVSFGHEMNGNWYPWGTGQATPAQFVRAWQRIHSLFRAAGATNVIWVWNPNIITPMPAVQLKPYYPGNSYVNWIGITGYFPEYGPATFSALFQATLTEIRSFTRKPFIISETSVQTGPADISCAQSLLQAVANQNSVLGFIWFDFNKAGVDWRVESRPALANVIAGAIASMPRVSLR